MKYRHMSTLTKMTSIKQFLLTVRKPSFHSLMAAYSADPHGLTQFSAVTEFMWLRVY